MLGEGYQTMLYGTVLFGAFVGWDLWRAGERSGVAGWTYYGLVVALAALLWPVGLPLLSYCWGHGHAFRSYGSWGLELERELEWYGDEGNYVDGVAPGHVEHSGLKVYDRGERARALLSFQRGRETWS